MTRTCGLCSGDLGTSQKKYYDGRGGYECFCWECREIEDLDEDKPEDIKED